MPCLRHTTAALGLVLAACAVAPRAYEQPRADPVEPKGETALAWTWVADFFRESWYRFESVAIEVEPGLFLRGVCALPRHGSAPIVLLLGASGPREETDADGTECIVYPPFWDYLMDGFGVLAVDYRGRGTSDGEFSRESVRADALALWNEAVRRAGGPERVVVRGSSIGAFAVEELVRAEVEPAAIAVFAPDPDARLEKPSGVRWMRRDDVDPDDLVPGEMELYGRAFPTMAFARAYPPSCFLRDFTVPVLEIEAPLSLRYEGQPRR